MDILQRTYIVFVSPFAHYTKGRLRIPDIFNGIVFNTISKRWFAGNIRIKKNVAW